MAKPGRKDRLRERVWRDLERLGVSRFPGPRGRIPNFQGAEAAAARLAGTDVWKRARTLKCNPDSPQRPVRHRALLEGKTVYMAVPRLRAAKPFLRIDPDRLERAEIWRASSIKGAAEFGEPVPAEEVPAIDLVVTGCVAVTREGARLGKGGGYSDLEYALLRELGKVGDGTPVATTVHPAQVLGGGEIPMNPHDLSLDLFATPDALVRCGSRFARPHGILWEALSEEKLETIPVLRELRAKEG